MNDSGEIVEWFGAASDVTARRRAELALKESEQRLRRLYESGLLGVIYWDTDGEITDANDKFLEMVGYTREEMRAGGIDWQNMTPPEFRHLDEASVRELQATGVNAAPFEKEYIRKDGSRISILLAGAMTDEARRNGVAFVLDVTERKRAEAALRQSERTLRLFIERAPVALAMFDRDMRCIHASPRWLSDYGLDRDVTGVSLYEVFPEIPKRWREIHRRALAGETIRAEEDRFLRANGEEQWLRWEVRPWRTSEDEVGGVILFSEDITTRKHAERQIAESEARYRALVDSAAAAIVVIDDKGIIHSVNPAVTTIFGYDPQELVGASVSILMPEDVARAHKDIEAYLRPGVVTKIIGTGREVVGRHRDGSLVDVHLTVAEWRDSQGKRFFVGRMNSIAERKRVEAELSDSRRMEAVGRLAAAVAHDSNNLLAVIVGNLALIDERVEDDGLRRLVRPALEAAEAGAALNRRLVSMSGQRQFKRAPLAVNDTVRDFASLLRSALGEQIVLELDLAEGLWKCIADRGEVHNALLNLATNARDASPRGGLVTIRTRNATIELMTAGSLQGARAGDYVSLSVADNGQGMAPEVLERALEPFFSTKADGKGVGLGLSGVHAFVRDAGGFVTIESREGMGTTVSLYLPRAPVATPTPAEAGAVEDVPLGDGEVVLVVEDDDQVRDVTLKRVEALGYVAEAARTGSEAVDMLKAGLRVDLVLSDIMMPGGMSGHDLARWVRREAPAVGVVLATGYDREVAQGEGAARDVPVLFKPYTRGELASALVMALDKTRL